MVTLITGGSGRLGKYLAREFSGSMVPSHTELDITDRRAVFEFIEHLQPDRIVHSAAWVDVRGCESDHSKAWAVNVGGTENMVDAVSSLGQDCYFIYPSTACVFDGKRGGYTEDDVPYPCNMYGVTKLVAEQVVNRLQHHLIIRTDFVDRARWRYEGAFIDRYSTCVFADTIARAIRSVVEADVEGLIHLTGRAKISHFELAKITTPEVKPIKLSDIDLPMPRDQSLKSVKGYDTLEL